MVSDAWRGREKPGRRRWRAAAASGSHSRMAREYTRPHDYYLPMHDMPIPHHSFPQYSVHPGSSGAAPGSYLVTPCAGDANHAHASLHQHHDVHKRMPMGPEAFEVASHGSSMAMSSNHPGSVINSSRKRKSSSYGTGSAFDDDGGDESSRSVPDKKQNHSEIEKRRRDKMNTYISELSSMIPMCGAVSRKLDKLTVLRMAVQHLRSIRGAISACPMTARPRPSFLSEREVNSLILQAAQDCFLLVVGCDRGRLFYVSTSVKKMLNYDQSELLGQSLFDILHPKDVAKVKEQLSSSDTSPRERLIDAKTMLPVKADVVSGTSCICVGTRRSFFCRIKCKTSPDPPTPPNGAPSSTAVKEENGLNTKLRKKQAEKKYSVVQCTGYLKSWAPAEVSETVPTEGVDEGETCNLSCLVAIARAMPYSAEQPIPQPRAPARCFQYVSRHAPNGKFIFVDQRVTIALGFLPQELLGTSLYEYVCGPELEIVARTHKAALVSREPLVSPPYYFRRKDGTMARITTHFKPFRNPWTKDVESLVANNTLVFDHHNQCETQTFEAYNMQKGEEDEMRRLIESHKIGSAVADEALGRVSEDMSPGLPVDLLQEVGGYTQQLPLADNLLSCDYGYSEVRNNVPLSAARVESPPPVCSPAPSTSSLPPIDGNGEAAMAVIMSLLEADAGLGGPVNFAGLPWPLP